MIKAYKPLLSIILLITITTMFSYITSALTIKEYTLKELNQKDIYITGVWSEVCTTINPPKPKDVNGEHFAILSLKASFEPVKDSAKIRVFYDENSFEDFRPSDFKNGVLRIEIPQENFLKNKPLRLCGITSRDVNSIVIKSDSVFGFYSGAYFPKDKGVFLNIETYSPFVGLPFKATAIAKNFGTKDAEVVLTYRKKELEEKTPEVSIVKGVTTKKGVVPKCVERDAKGFCLKPGEYSTEYYIVANKAIPFTLLPAVLEYTNVFGEKSIVLSNRPSLESKEPPHKLAVKLDLDKDVIYDKAPKLVFTVKNVSNSVVNDIVVKPKTGFEIIGEKSKKISYLPPQGEEKVFFETKQAPNGYYNIGCLVEYEGRVKECESTALRIESVLNQDDLMAVLLSIIGVAVFIFIYFRK